MKSASHRLRFFSHFAFLIFPLFLLWRTIFVGKAFFWGTPLLQFVPWQRLAVAMWRDGHLPLWNSLVGCGAPLAANYQTAAFYPLNLLYLLLPVEVALSWTTMLHLALAGWGMYRWGRAVGLDRFPALIGALALEGSGFLVARAALFPSMVFTFPWLAVWLWRAELLVRRKRVRDVLWLGVSLGLGLLAGHAQTAFYGGVLLAAYIVLRIFQDAGGRKQEVASLLVRVGVSLVLGIGLAAVQLIPTAELTLSSQRSGGMEYDFAMTYSLWPWRLITFVAPDFLGNPGRGNYAGYPNYWEGAGYVGLLPLLLAVEAILGRKRNKQEGRTNQVRFWGVGVMVTLVLALGKNTPVFPFLFRYVPGFNLFQAPARWLAVTTVALAALAALGSQRWPAGHRGRRLGALGIAVGISLLLGGLAAPRLVPDLPTAFGPATARLGGTLAIAGVLMLLRRDAAWWRAALVGFIALDLLLFGRTLMPTVGRSLYYGRTESATFLSGEPGPVRIYWPTDPVRPNSDYGAEHRVKFSYLTFDDFGLRDVDYWQGMREALLPNAGMLDGVASANNFDPLLVGRYVDFLQAVAQNPALLHVMGVTHVASDRSWPGGELAHAGASTALYRLPDSLGRAWIVSAARQLPPDEVLAALADPAFDPTAEVLLEAAHPPIRPSANSQIHKFDNSLSLQDGANRVTIHASLDAPGYLVLADTWYSGWQATIDGERVELLRANYGFRAVSLDEGDHIVEMFYRPLSVYLGAIVTLGTVISMVVIGLASWRRRG
ncbi:MAG: YfhO family protein [Chloroflexi bacterium]|nr:YfhO family protein [Chloroflexota bacterium]